MNARWSCDTIKFSSLRGSADHPHILLVAGQVVRLALRVEPDQQLVGIAAAARALVEVRAGARPAAVKIVEFEVRRTEIRHRLGIALPFQAGGRIEGDVMVDELAEEGEVIRPPR